MKKLLSAVLATSLVAFSGCDEKAREKVGNDIRVSSNHLYHEMKNFGNYLHTEMKDISNDIHSGNSLYTQRGASEGRVLFDGVYEDLTFTIYGSDGSKDIFPHGRVELSDGWTYADRNGDGVIDYMRLIRSNGTKFVYDALSGVETDNERDAFIIARATYAELIAIATQHVEQEILESLRKQRGGRPIPETYIQPLDDSEPDVKGELPTPLEEIDPEITGPEDKKT